MARSFAQAFYHSKEWKDCKASYIRKMPIYKRGLCEECYAQGKHTLGKELHHKIWLNEKNIHNRSITLNHDNLILLCFDCHQNIHGNRKQKDYSFDAEGNIICMPPIK